MDDVFSSLYGEGVALRQRGGVEHKIDGRLEEEADVVAEVAHVLRRLARGDAVSVHRHGQGPEGGVFPDVHLKGRWEAARLRVLRRDGDLAELRAGRGGQTEVCAEAILHRLLGLPLAEAHQPEVEVPRHAAVACGAR